MGFGNDCFGHNAKNTEKQSKNKHMELHKLKNFCTVKQETLKDNLQNGKSLQTIY